MLDVLEKPMVLPLITELYSFGQLAAALFPREGQSEYEGGRRMSLTSPRIAQHAQFFCTREMFELLFGRREFGPSNRPVNFALLGRMVSDATTDGLKRSEKWRKETAKTFRLFEAAAELALVRAVKAGKIEAEELPW